MTSSHSEGLCWGSSMSNLQVLPGVKPNAQSGVVWRFSSMSRPAGFMPQLVCSTRSSNSRAYGAMYLLLAGYLCRVQVFQRHSFGISMM